MALSKITTNSIADDAVTTAKVNPAQTDITSVGTLTGLTVGSSNPQLFLNATSDGGEGSVNFKDDEGNIDGKIAYRTDYAGNTDNYMTFNTNGSNERMRIDSNGYVTKSQQVYVFASGNGTRHNQTSANTEQSLDFTEYTDNTNSFNTSGGIFTAPVAGRYFIHYYASTKSNTSYIQLYVKHNSSIVATDYNELPNNSNDWSAQQVTVILDLSASDTVQPFMVSGGTNAYALENYYRGCSIYLLG